MQTFTKENLIAQFRNNCNQEPSDYFDIGGRVEVLGNHTDHNHGLCIVTSIDLTMGVAAKKTDDNMITIVSKGHGKLAISLDDLTHKNDGSHTSTELIKGILFYLKSNGYKIGGFIAYMESDILPGGGASSSAAFEVMIGQIQNHYYNDGKIHKLTLCKAGQYSENNYMGKNSGLLDQIGVAYGGVNVIDFNNISDPEIETLKFDFADLHYVLVNSGGSHENLTPQYAAIPNDMFEVASHYGQKFLRDIDENSFRNDVTNNHFHYSVLAKKRAEHFFDENKRVETARRAVEDGNEDLFLKMVNESQDSSHNKLCNTQVEGCYEGSPQEAVDYAYALFGDGACKINGGGFAGTIICFVKDKYFPTFMEKMNERYGKDNIIEIKLRKSGVVNIKL